MTEEAGQIPSVEVVAEYTEEHFRRAVRRYMVRRVGWSHAFNVFALPLILALILSRRAPQALFDPPLSAWLLPLIGGMAAGIGYFFFQYRKCLRVGLATLRKLDPPQVTFTFAPDGLAFTHSLGSTRFNGSAMSHLELWRYPDMWMLFIGKHAWHTLPVESFDERTQRFVGEQVRAHGGKVR